MSLFGPNSTSFIDQVCFRSRVLNVLRYFFSNLVMEELDMKKAENLALSNRIKVLIARNSYTTKSGLRPAIRQEERGIADSSPHLQSRHQLKKLGRHDQPHFPSLRTLRCANSLPKSDPILITLPGTQLSVPIRNFNYQGSTALTQPNSTKTFP